MVTGVTVVTAAGKRGIHKRIVRLLGQGLPHLLAYLQEGREVNVILRTDMIADRLHIQGLHLPEEATGRGADLLPEEDFDDLLQIVQGDEMTILGVVVEVR